MSKHYLEQNKSKSSITRRYAVGYLLLLLLLCLTFIVSFIGNLVISKLQDSTITDFLTLNELYVNIESTNDSIHDNFIYLTDEKLENYFLSKEKSQTALEGVRILAQNDYSRDIVDLISLVETYLEKSDSLIKHLQENTKSYQINTAEITSLNNELLEVNEFINKSFRTIYSDKLAATVSLQQWFSDVRFVINVFQISVLIVALIVFLRYYRKVVRDLSGSVKQLTKFALDVSEDPYNKAHIDIKTEDELDLFAKTFNNMLDTIKKQMQQIESDALVHQHLQQIEIENMRISSALHQSKLKLLQGRITPHFLFNTLNMISQTAYMENAEETAFLIETTADLLRYNLGKLSTPVTLKAELVNLNDYITIQQKRFGNRIKVLIYAEPECENLEVPCLIVQPLVENSLTHGIGDRIDGGKIIVRLFSSDGKIWLCVEDDGVGIPKDKLEELRESLHHLDENNQQHIGVINVYQRLKLYFGDYLEFIIDSNDEKTIIKIGMPGTSL